MAYNPSILDTNIISRGARESKIDLATPVNMFNQIKSARAQQKLSELTLSETDKAIKRKKQYEDILSQSLNENGTVNGEKAIAGLNQFGLFDEANQLKDRMFKSYEMQQKKKEYQSKVETAITIKKGQLAGAVLDSKSPLETFIKMRRAAQENKFPLSPGLMQYNPSDEDIQNNTLDPRITTELEYLRDKSLTPEQRIAKVKAEKQELEPTEYSLAPIYGKKGNEIVAFQTSKTGGLKQIDVPEGITLTPGLQYQNIGDKIVGFDKSGTPVLSIKKGIEPGKGKELEFKAEEFEQKKVDIARKNRAYKQKNKSQLDSIQTFLDKAYSVSKSPYMGKVSGAGRFLPGGSEIPIWETKGKDLQADIDFLTDMGVIETMTKLKAESPTGSTGFGALSEKELMVMKNAFSLLGNPEISGKKKKIEVDRVIEIMERRAREQRAYDRGAEELLGPEKTETDLLLEGIDGL